MSKIQNNPLLKGVSGMLGNIIVFRETRGQMIMANRPKKSGTLTEHQEAQKSRFLKAVQYARNQLLNAQSKAEYAARITLSKHSAYLVAVTDYLTSPEVTVVDVSAYKGVAGDLIKVVAIDDFKVTGVEVIITDTNGTLIEQGQAVLPADSADQWQYTITAPNAVLPGTKIIAHAVDKPGNTGTLEVTLP
jgi:hypothetical protein